MKRHALISSCFLYMVLSCSQTANRSQDHNENTEHEQKDECSWCGTAEAPGNVSWQTKIPPGDEPGDKLMISGIVYQPDGKTPAEGVVIYLYHTNIEGKYPKIGNETGNGKFHGYLRGWMKTNSEGKYKFETIRPSPYHSHGGEPAHIHYTLEATDYPEYWVSALWFADDPRVTDEYLDKVKRSGGFSNVVALTRDENNILAGERNIILERFED